MTATKCLAGRHHPGFSVDNVDAVIDELKRRDVTIASEPHDVPAMGLRVAFFADPWGNLFEVIQSITQRGQRTIPASLRAGCIEG
jgi:catechol 2,3-dioxygenase-like lactoylglutathione lyase family enzyme